MSAKAGKPTYTPMMEQYFAMKRAYPQCLMFFRFGDFYEMFFEDAVTASRALDITLTARDCGQAERAPMCGVPHHALENYLARLVEQGYHVAICEQMEDPKQAKGLVKREVVRVVTPGTVTNTQMLPEKRYNFIVALYGDDRNLAIAAADITTGLFVVAAIPKTDTRRLADELTRLNPAEMLIPEGFPLRAMAEAAAGVKAATAPMWTYHPANAFKCLTQHFKTHHLEGFGLLKRASEVPPAGALLQYIMDTQKNALFQITAIRVESVDTRMVLDAASRRNLELTGRTREARDKKDTLLSVLDFTRTAMGGRLLLNWIERPLRDPAEITKRLDAVDEWKTLSMKREELRELLAGIHDLERLMTRLAGTGANARDLVSLGASVARLKPMKELLADCEAETNAGLYHSFDDLADIGAAIASAITENPPVTVREGGIIRAGYDAELDGLLSVKENGERWLSELEARERAATGIKTLRVRFNKVFGYSIEISNAQKDNAPAHYIRRQTLSTGERFITEELKQLEETILNVHEKQSDLEYALFDTLRRGIVEQMARVQYMAQLVAAADALQSLAEAAERHGFTRPRVNGSDAIRIQGGRHPVVERVLGDGFIPNDTDISGGEGRLSIITGPNMAGKSTYMRQVALIVLMAQTGCFVPAAAAEIGVVDRIFTRVGAADDLATGQSTFMVEMTEVANILHNATEKSLVILDEIGRGTSTFDGLSIAWAVLEHIAGKVRAKTLFATHYHELTELEGQVPGAVNFCFAVRESSDDIIFLRKLTRGGAGRSYGIHVARLAGLPPKVLARARTVLDTLLEADITKRSRRVASAVPDAGFRTEACGIQNASVVQVEDDPLRVALTALDIDRITPLEALMELERLRQLV